MEGYNSMLLYELLSVAQKHIVGAYAVRQLRSQETKELVHSLSQRDTALSMKPLVEFKIFSQNYPTKVSSLPLETKAQGGRHVISNLLV